MNGDYLVLDWALRDMANIRSSSLVNQAEDDRKKKKKLHDVAETICLYLYGCALIAFGCNMILKALPYFSKRNPCECALLLEKGIQRMVKEGRASRIRPPIYLLPVNDETSLYEHEERKYGRKATIRRIRRFLSPDECAEVVRGVGDRWSRSEVMRLGREGGDADTCVDVRVRTSSTYQTSDVGIYRKIKKRVAAYMAIEPGRIEKLQVVRYLAGEKFEAHVDYFDVPSRGCARATGLDDQNDLFEEHHGGRYSEATVATLLKEGGQRVYTMFVYLNDSDGATRFPDLDGATYEPSTGDAILFCSFDRRGKLNPYVKHEGCPPSAKGSPKYGLNVWIREYPPGANLKKLL